VKPIARHMDESGVSVDDLVRASRLDKTLVHAIVRGNHIPSPSQRRRLADALCAKTDDISWGHAVPVDHMRGNGPQSGRPT